MPPQQAFLPISISHDNQLFVLDFTCAFSTLKKYIPLAHLHIHIMRGQVYSYFHILAGLTDLGFGFLNVILYHLWKNKHKSIPTCFSRELNLPLQDILDPGKWKPAKATARFLPLLWKRGEAQVGEKARLAVSERDPGGDELIWMGATAPSTTKARKERSGARTHVYSSCCAVAFKAKPKLLIWNDKPHNPPECTLGTPFSQSTNMHKHVFNSPGERGGTWHV